MKSLRFLPFGSIVAPSVAALALAGLSACDNAKDAAKNAEATSQTSAVPADEASERDDAEMEADGAKRGEMWGRRGADDRMGPESWMPGGMGGSNTETPKAKPDASPDTPAKDER